MPAERRYSFDTSSLIRLSRRGLDAPVHDAVWRALGSDARTFQVRIVEHVFNEIGVRVDVVAERVARLRTPSILVPGSMFKEGEPSQLLAEVQREYPRMSSANKGRERADSWIVAHARFEHGTTIVTEESPRRSANIPAACRRYGVECINLEEFLRRESLI